MAALGTWRASLEPGTYIAEGPLAYRRGRPSLRFLHAHGLLRREGGIQVGLRRAARRALGLRQVLRVRDARGAAGPGGFRGSVLLAKPRKVLLLDPHGGRVLHAYLGEPRFRGHADRPAILLRHVPAPRVLVVSRPERILVEELVAGKARSTWSDAERADAERFVHEAVCRYLRAARSEPVLWGAPTTPAAAVSALRDAAGLAPLAELFAGAFALDEAGDVTVPRVHVHGDLRLANLVRAKHGFVALDWEFSGMQPFFFDALHWIFMELRYHDDIAPLRSYLTGAMDDLFGVVFAAAGETFDARLRSLYLGVYLVERARDRSLGRDAAAHRRQHAYYERLLAREDVSALLQRPASRS